MAPRRMLALVAVLGASAAPAVAGPMAISGTVTDATSQWSDDGSHIFTDATIATPTGDVVVRELGGTVDGLTMRTMPGPPVLEPGMVVDVAAHLAPDGSQQMHVVLDDAKILEDVPGFVRTGPTKAGHYLYWESGCVFVTPDAAGTSEIAGNDEFPIIDASIATWNDDTHTSSCSYLHVVENAPEAVEVKRDYKNVIKFRDDKWCRPASGNDPEHCYSPSAAGITTVAYVDDGSSSRDGALVDADIEINGVNFAISDRGTTLGSAPCLAELQNTLTHELGHLHGLEHTCLSPGDPPRIDGNGNAVPACSQTNDPTIVDATMYPFQDCGETKKESLSPDDVNAICTIYPVANDPHTCSPPEMGGGCCDAGRDARGSVVLALGVLVGLRRRRR